MGRQRCEATGARSDRRSGFGLGCVAILVLAMTACSGGGPAAPTSAPSQSQGPTPSQGPTAGDGPSATSTPEASTHPSGTASAARADAERRVTAMTQRQKAGQVIMAGVPVGDGRSALQSWGGALERAEIGNVFLFGRSSAGLRDVAGGIDGVRESTTVRGLEPWIAVDQEGGSVQTLKGSGFSQIPNALAQGAQPEKRLREQARTWGDQLARAGVNMNLAPVADTVPTGTAGVNPPIGYFSRQYGSTPETVASRAGAFADGMGQAGVTPVIKHFPGLGLVRGNTDVAADVTDQETGPGSEQVRPFADLIDDGARWIMVSSATYPRLDPKAPATFSEPVLTGFLREELGFDGAVISDDLCSARAVRSIPLRQRAQRFLEAGGDLFLCAGGAPRSQVAELSDAIVSAAESDPEMGKALDRAATTVVAGKLEAQG
jgi:beta-N-acetylhexosaminidase